MGCCQVGAPTLLPLLLLLLLQVALLTILIIITSIQAAQAAAAVQRDAAAAPQHLEAGPDRRPAQGNAPPHQPRCLIEGASRQGENERESH